ncbi:tRNA pseudouridine(55) synthase TruB [Patescibacteria group bacterium]
MDKKSGFLLINKPSGPTSHDIIDELRRITGIRKIGHAGTLDPFASGLLIVAVGREATRNISRLVKLDKTYVAKLKLGATSDTYDCTGKITPTPVIPSESREAGRVEGSHIKKALKQFEGEQEQVPPMFSAKKVKGKKLYELARKGVEVERKPATIIIERLKLLKYEHPYIIIEGKVSSGTYIRSLAHDIGQKLGCGAYLEELERIEIGEYKLKDAMSTDKLTPENWEKSLF